MFKTLTKIIKGQKLSGLTEQEQKKYNSFMMCRYLSGDSRTVMLSNIINCNYKIDNECQSILISEFCKNNKINFIKYPKTSIEKIDVSDIMKKYNISYEKALEYHNLKVINE